MTFLYTPRIPPVPTSLKERRSGRCQGCAAGPEPHAAAGKHGEDLPLDSRRARRCYALCRLVWRCGGACISS